MRVCTILPQRVKQENEVAMPSKAKRNRNLRSASTILRRSGKNRRCPGMGGQRARWRSPLARRCGINLPFPLLRSVGCSFVIQKAATSQWRGSCTDQDAEALQIVEWFVLRWTVEVTFHEVRAHLGVETQRQWSDLAILRTTPALLALFSLVTVFAQQLLGEHPFPIRQAAWYSKALPTFSDTLAFVRQHLWPSTFFSVSSPDADTVQIPRALFDRLVDTLAFAA